MRDISFDIRVNFLSVHSYRLMDLRDHAIGMVSFFWGSVINKPFINCLIFNTEISHSPVIHLSLSEIQKF